jgi:hypothetical protein
VLTPIALKKKNATRETCQIDRKLKRKHVAASEE